MNPCPSRPGHDRPHYSCVDVDDKHRERDIDKGVGGGDCESAMEEAIFEFRGSVGKNLVEIFALTDECSDDER